MMHVPQIILILFLCSCSITKELKYKNLYSKEEMASIEQCNTAKLSWYMGYESKRIIFLCNLLRVNPSLFHKYLDLQTDSLYKNHKGLDSIISRRENSDLPTKTKLIKPSFNLFITSKIHAIHSGLNGQMGHQNLDVRMKLGLNFNRTYGENCIYGYYGAFEAIVGWIESPGHYKNLVRPLFYRTGVSGFRHKYQGINYVQVFSGKKWRDLLIKQ